MKCDKCESTELLRLSGHTCDSFYMSNMKQPKEGYDGYPPSDTFMGDMGDDIEMTVCLSCGKIQGDYFPTTWEKIMKGTE